MDNRLVITGAVANEPETRYTPAGVPLVRFAVEHESQQTEAGTPRRVQCKIRVVAAGDELAKQARSLAPGTPVRLTGFLNRSGYRSEFGLVLHVLAIELLNV